MAKAVSHGANRKKFDFLFNDAGSMPFRANTGVGLATTFVDGAINLSIGAAVGSGSLDMNATGLLAVDLISIEFLIKLKAIDVNSRITLGVASAYNADPDVVAESAWFKIIGTGASDAHSVVIESDDATTNIDDEATSKTLVIDAWSRMKIDFATGIQSISSPGVSKGGLGSLRYEMGRTSVGSHFMSKISPTQHMDFSAVGAAIQLQPMILTQQVTALASPATVLQVKEIILEYQTH